MAKRKIKYIKVTREEMETFLTEVCQSGGKSNHPRAFNESEVDDIRRRTIEGVSRLELAESLGVSVATIGSVILGKHAYWYDGDND